MTKYFAIFKTIVSSSTVYRFGLFFDTFQSFLTPTFILLALSFAKSSSLQANTLWPYYLVVSILGPIIRPNVHDQLYDLTRTGDVANYFTRPINLYGYLFSYWSSHKVINLIALSPVLFPISFFLPNQSSWSGILILPLCFILYFNLAYLLGLMSFWLDEFWAISNVFDVIVIILGGILLPYQFFPTWFNKFIFLTPFPYTTNWLARTTLVPFAATEIATAFFWIVLTFIVILFLQSRAFRHHSVIGG